MNPRWAPLATTGIGSLPFTDDSVSFRVAAEVDVSFVPERLHSSPQERLLERTLAGLVAGQPDLSSLLRSLERLPAGLIKSQVCGPTTLRAYGGLSEGDAVRWCAEVTRATIAAIRSTGRECVVFIDEPALALHPALELQPVIDAAQGAVAIGVHCCGNTDWEHVLRWPIDLISFDVRLSLDALIEPRAAWTQFLQRGGGLAFGVIPTTPVADFRLDEACDSIEAALRSTTKDFSAVLRRSMLTPACGLGLSTEAYALEAMTQLRSAQAILRRNGQPI